MLRTSVHQCQFRAPKPGTFNRLGFHWINPYWKTENSLTKHRPSGPMLFEVPFKRLFAPTSWPQMSKIIRDLESLGKSNRKKFSHFWNFLLMKGVKLPRKKKLLLGEFCKDQEVILCLRESDLFRTKGGGGAEGGQSLHSLSDFFAAKNTLYVLPKSQNKHCVHF